MTRQRFKRHAVKARGSEDRAARPVPVGVDVQTREGNAGRIGERKIALRRQRLGRRNRELARPPARMKFQRLVFGGANAAAGVHA